MADFQTDFEITSIRFSPDGKYVACQGGLECLIYDTSNYKLIDTLAVHPDKTSFHKKYGLAVFGNILIWSRVPVKLNVKNSTDDQALSNDSQWFAVYDKNLEVINLKTGRKAFTHKIKGYFATMKFSPDGKRLYYASTNTLHILSVPDGAMIGSQVYPGYFSDFAFMPDQKHGLVSLQESELKLFELDSARELQTFPCPGVTSSKDIAVTPDGRYAGMISCIDIGDDEQIYAVRIVDLNTGDVCGLLKIKDYIRTWSMAPNGGALAAASNYELVIWRLSEFLKTQPHEIPEFKSGQKAKKLFNELASIERHGVKLENVYEISHGLLPGQAQFQSGSGVYEFLLNPKAASRTIPLKLRYGKKVFDVMHMDPGLMVHERVIELLKAKNFKGWSAVPLKVSFKKDQKPNGKYFGLKVNSDAGEMVKEARIGHSDYRPLMDLRKWDGCDFFRPSTHAFYLVTERVIQALTEAGVTGWKAERVTDKKEAVAPPPGKPKAVLADPNLPAAKPKVDGSRPPSAKIDALIKKHGLSKHAEKINATAEYAVHLKSCTPPKGIDGLGATRLGGMPDLKSGAGWPRVDGKPLAFVAQLQLADFSKCVNGSGLPGAGLLSIFVNYDSQQKWDVSDRQWSVLYQPDSKALTRMTPPADLITEAQLDSSGVVLRPITSLPHSESDVVKGWKLADDEADAYSELLENLERLNKASEPRHQLLGHGQWLQNDATRIASKDAAKAKLVKADESWRLLLQLETDDRLGVSFGGDGLLYVLISENDLMQKKFDRCWMEMQFT